MPTPNMTGAPNPMTDFAGWVQWITEDTQRQIEEANEANERRYRQGLDLLTDARQKTMAETGDIYGQQRQDILDLGEDEKAAFGQEMVNRGLTGTTITGTQGGANRRTSERLQRLATRKALTRADLRQGTTRPIADWIFRRNDVPPNMQQTLQTVMGAANSPWAEDQIEALRRSQMNEGRGPYEQFQGYRGATRDGAFRPSPQFEAWYEAAENPAPRFEELMNRPRYDRPRSSILGLR